MYACVVLSIGTVAKNGQKLNDSIWYEHVTVVQYVVLIFSACNLHNILCDEALWYAVEDSLNLARTCGERSDRFCHLSCVYSWFQIVLFFLFECVSRNTR